MEERPSTAHRIAGTVILLSSLSIAIYGICIGRWDALFMAAAWYFIVGGLTMQQISDIQELWRGNGVGEDASKSKYNKQRKENGRID